MKWINETEQERARLEGEVSAIPADQAISGYGLAEVSHRTGELARAVADAHPHDKTDLYRELGLRMTYYPQKRLAPGAELFGCQPAPGHAHRGQHLDVSVEEGRPVAADGDFCDDGGVKFPRLVLGHHGRSAALPSLPGPSKLTHPA
ncbi:hypothetical protein D0T12_04660 [Actinomadura spongiicola]|uniref:Uncharacterized protein n=1 Tax=Actinomadura spongiicola TaxID=2303421 RepID=A0A372GQ68_9ACTN|nr:hypothetical protein [Actinomadura spongiicola]RFS87510.1 hypothetical protein D0T12_04660 [Actinomadura spongiicola]